MARIMACRPIVSLNRQEAEIAAERLGVKPENLGAEWQRRFGAALIVRHDKDGAAWYDGDASGVVPAFPATVVDTIGAGDSHAGGTLPGWRQDGHWQMPFCWGMPWRPGWSATAAVIAPHSRGTTPRTQRRIDRYDSS
jgi:sugar/nucleoside kinase (ribokinase family)